MLYFITLITIFSSGCSKQTDERFNTETLMGNEMKITVGTVVFHAMLEDNSTARAFKAILPLNIDMNELDGVEKYFYFPTDVTLPANATNPGIIQRGDLMLYGNNCLVLFYSRFRTSYTYTRIATINNPNALADALGTRGVTVKFE